ncbi:SOS response-associated peptidase [Crenalkalicoccus roseus]|uniref:SOS response-associated peptidase n=1 Tax=Crenalkalicoccus roseus TaxID=1485588 RepID=UPI001081BCF9|nr:SOS response-associated peptidase [Crenalkalicoccus roseus]
MCGRYALYRSPAALARHFGTANPVPNHPPSWNVAPTQDALVVRRHPETGLRHLGPLRWGLVPRWARDASGAARMINARAETVATLPAFRDAFRRRRCLVPADAFYEWRAAAPGAPKQPFAVAAADGAPLALAGLWEGWRSPKGEVLRSFCIVTTAANKRLRPLHPRMPVMLPRAAWPAWLGEEEAEEAALRALLAPDAAPPLDLWPVSPRVGRVAENDAGLLERDPAGAAPPPGDPGQGRSRSDEPA